MGMRFVHRPKIVVKREIYQVISSLFLLFLLPTRFFQKQVYHQATKRRNNSIFCTFVYRADHHQVDRQALVRGRMGAGGSHWSNQNQ